MDQDDKKKLERLKKSLEWDCYMASVFTKDPWFKKKYEELKSPPPITISKKEAQAKLRQIQRLEKKISEGK